MDVLRFTPAGLAKIALKIRHASTQQEAGQVRQILCDIPALAFGVVAQQTSHLQLGRRVRAEGFLAQRSLKIAQLVLHIDKIILE